MKNDEERPKRPKLDKPKMEPQMGKPKTNEPLKLL